MSPSELPIVVTPSWLRRWPKDGTPGIALHSSPCPSAQPPNGKNPAHRINPGDPIVFVAGAWRCLPCGRRIRKADQ